jgi:hypothetical protein
VGGAYGSCGFVDRFLASREDESTKSHEELPKHAVLSVAKVRGLNFALGKFELLTLANFRVTSLKKIDTELKLGY